MRRQLDPPDHTRLRSLVNKAFTRQAVNLLEPRIRGLMATLLDDIDDPAGFDLMKAVANPLPVTIIAEMLGVPPEDRTRSRVFTLSSRFRIVMLAMTWSPFVSMGAESYMVTKPEWSISDVRKCVAHAPRLPPSGREPVRRRTAQAPSRPTITTEQTFWWGKPPRLWVRPSTGSFSRWRSPARPSIWR